MRDNAVTNKKGHNYYPEYIHERTKNDELSTRLMQLDRENERLFDKIEALETTTKKFLYQYDLQNTPTMDGIYDFENSLRNLRKALMKNEF